MYIYFSFIIYLLFILLELMFWKIRIIDCRSPLHVFTCSAVHVVYFYIARNG